MEKMLFVHAVARRVNLGGVSEHITRINREVNERLRGLQERGAEVVDVRVQVAPEHYPSTRGIITYLIIYEAEHSLPFEE